MLGCVDILNALKFIFIFEKHRIKSQSIRSKVGFIYAVLILLNHLCDFAVFLNGFVNINQLKGSNLRLVAAHLKPYRA